MKAILKFLHFCSSDADDYIKKSSGKSDLDKSKSKKEKTREKMIKKILKKMKKKQAKKDKIKSKKKKSQKSEKTSLGDEDAEAVWVEKTASGGGKHILQFIQKYTICLFFVGSRLDWVYVFWWTNLAQPHQNN